MQSFLLIDHGNERTRLQDSFLTILIPHFNLGSHPQQEWKNYGNNCSVAMKLDISKTCDTVRRGVLESDASQIGL